MVSAEKRQADILQLIAENPQDIRLEILSYSILDGARVKVPTIIDTRGRIFMQRAWDSDQSAVTAGTINQSSTYGLVLSNDVNLRDTAYQDITIYTHEGKMKVVAIYPQFAKGILCGYQIDLERIT